MRVRLDLAALALAESRYVEALEQARTAAKGFKARGMLDSETEAEALVAQALLKLGRLKPPDPELRR